MKIRTAIFNKTEIDNQRQPSMNKISAFLSIAALIVSSLTGSVFGYNWTWDQGHDCTTLNGVPGRYGFDGGFNPDQCCPCVACNVYSLSGAYFETATDITLSGNGPAISLSRTWNSNDLASGLVGNGWTFSLGRNVVPVKGNDGQEYLVVKRTNGQEIRMVRQGNSYAFSTDMLYGFKIEKTTAGWKLTEQDGTVQEYNSDGKLARMIDKNGLVTVLNYSASGCLAGLINTNSQRLDFTLNPNGKLETVSDNNGRTVTFVYDGSNNLTRVEYWDGTSVNYTYDSQNLLRTISNRRSQTIRQIVYNQQGQAIEVREKGEVFSFVHNKATKTITKTDSKGRVWTKIYDENSINVIERDPLGFEIRRQPSNVAGPRQFEWTSDQNGHRTNFTYSSSGDMISRTDPLGNTEYWSYDANHQVTSHTDAAGVITRYSYDQQGNMTEKKEAAGTADQKVWQYTYDSQGNMLSETNPAGAVTAYEYDALGNKTKQTGPLGEEVVWTYDNLGRMTSMTDPLGNTWTHTYDARGNQLTETDPLGNVTSREYDVDNNLIAETDALGNRTSYVYDAWNRLTKRIGPLQDTTIQQYVTIGDDDYSSGTRDAMGHWTYSQYDNGGRKIAEIVKMGDTLSTPDANDLVTQFAYDPSGNVLRITSPEGDTTGYVYDDKNQRTKQCNGMGECTQTTYDAEGRVAQITQPNGNVISYTYNDLGQVVRIADNIGVINEKKYDLNGSVVWDRTPGRGAMVYSYDIAGRVVHQKDSTGVGNRFTYDLAGRVKTSTDSLHNTTERGYDALGRLIWTRNALGDTVKNQYDANGSQTALIDPDGNTTNFYFDAAGRTVATKYPDNGIDSVNYDKVGRVATKKDPRQIVTTFFYDDAGRLLRKTYSDGTTPEDLYTYDNNGRMLTANNSVAQLTWQYDNASRPTHYQQVVDGQTDVLQYGYNVASGVSLLTYPDGKVVQRKMDLRNRLDSVVVDGSLVVADYDYIGMAISTKILGNGIVASYSYDKAGRLTRLAYTGGASTLPDFSYGYDMAGNMRYAMKNHQTDMSETYEYDAVSQLTRWRRGTLSLSDTAVPSPNYYQEWIFDKRGNWDVFNDNGTTTNRSFSPINTIENIDNQDFSYDNTGNLLDNGKNTYVWNAKNLPISTNHGQIKYDALNRKIVEVDDGGKKVLHFYNNWQLLQRKNELGVLKTYLYGVYLDEPIIEFSKNENIQNTYYFIQEVNFNVSAVTDNNGNVVEYYNYKPFGSVEVFNGNGDDSEWFSRDDISQNCSDLNNVLFQGREMLGSCNLIYFRNRYFDNSNKVWMSKDPFESTQRINRYLFLQNSPLNEVDPYGLTTIGEILGEFFSPFSSEHLWVMNQSDPYTVRVRNWQPVINAVNQAKNDISSNCSVWGSNHKTDASWVPGRTDPPSTDPNSWGNWVSSPPGTDPATAKDAFITYILWGVQTDALYTSSIGSFGIYVTVDDIDCKCKKSKMKVWMYNAMDRDSFGRYADHWAFSLSGMQRQYMWWNWTIDYNWSSNGSNSSNSSSGGGW